MVAIDDPKPSYYGGTVAAPVFQEVIERSLLYLGRVPREGGTGRIKKVFVRASGSEPQLPKSPPRDFQGASLQVR